MFLAVMRTLETVGMRMAASMPMMAMTVRSSIKVNALGVLVKRGADFMGSSDGLRKLTRVEGTFNRTTIKGGAGVD